MLHGCETCSRAFSNKKQNEQVENTMLRTIFGTKEKGVTRGRRNAHNQHLHDLRSSPNIITAIKLTTKGNGQVGCIGEKRNAEKRYMLEKTLQGRDLFGDYGVHESILCGNITPTRCNR